jgi:hypothetical protein
MKYIFWGLPFLLLLFGCDDGDFSPVRPTDKYFSLNGFLDADADTQFVRISPLRASPVLDTTPLQAKVVLEDLTTGQKMPMTEAIKPVKDANAIHTFWTTYKLTSGRSYRITATNAEGKSSTSTVQMPNVTMDIEGKAPWNSLNPTEEFAQNVIIHNPKYLVRFKINYFLIDQNTKLPFIKTYTIDKTTYDVLGDPAFDLSSTTYLKEISGNKNVSITHLDVSNITIELIASQNPLPDPADFERYATAPENSNVTNGFGLIATGMTFKRDWRPLVTYLQTWLRARKDWRN